MKVIKTLEDGGILRATWYDVQITAIRRGITVKMDMHNPGNDATPEDYGPFDDGMKVII